MRFVGVSGVAGVQCRPGQSDPRQAQGTRLSLEWRAEGGRLKAEGGRDGFSGYVPICSFSRLEFRVYAGLGPPEGGTPNQNRTLPFFHSLDNHSHAFGFFS